MLVAQSLGPVSCYVGPLSTGFVPELVLLLLVRLGSGELGAQGNVWQLFSYSLIRSTEGLEVRGV